MNPSLYWLNTERKNNKLKHICAVGEKDYLNIQPKLEILQRLAEVERSEYAVFDMNKGHFLLQSSEQKRLFSQKKQLIDKEDQYNNIHPDDLAFVLETDNLVYSFIALLPPAEKKDYKLVYDFRTKNKEGIYTRHMHQVLVLEQDKKGKSWLILIISNILSEQAQNKVPQRRMINIKTGKLHLFNSIDNVEYQLVLTKRETEVIEFIARGYDSVNISEKLNISINTVNNHRQNILRKTQTENSTQAVMFCKSLGLI